VTRTFANYNAVHQILDAPQVLRERGVGASAFLVLLIIAATTGIRMVLLVELHDNLSRNSSQPEDRHQRS